jgi:GNAT superfamily N-acetyltransferase
VTRTSEAKIRAATVEDAAEVARLSAAFAAHLRRLGDDAPGPLTEAAYRLHGFGPKPMFQGLVAEVDGRTAGYLLYHYGYDADRCAPITHVIDLFVDPGLRRQGVGRRLVSAACEEARKVGAVELFWAVYRKNALAYAFYEGLGATCVEEVSFMRLKLA